MPMSTRAWWRDTHVTTEGSTTQHCGKQERDPLCLGAQDGGLALVLKVE